MATPEPSKGAAPLAAYVAFVIAAAVLVYSFVSVAREGESRRRCSALCLLHPNYAGANRRAPDFSLKDMTGKSVSLSSYRGKVVVLNFWTRTCGPCLEEMPEIADLARILKDRTDTAVVAISIDQGPDEVTDTLKTVLNGQKPPFPILFDPDGDNVVMGKFGTHLFPETWIIDKRGIIRARFDGAREWSNSAVVELIDDIRKGGYCPVQIKDGETTGPAARLCESPTG